MVNRGGELALGVQRERSPTGGICVAGRVGPDAGGGLGERGQSPRRSHLASVDGFRITATLTLSKQNLRVSNDNMLEEKKIQ